MHAWSECVYACAYINGIYILFKSMLLKRD